jgi:hypothetical protein
MKKVVVECDPDELLVKTLGLGRKEIVHQNNKGEVCNYLAKSEIKIALIDEDPGQGQPNYLKNFSFAEQKFDIKKLTQIPTGKIILIIKPRLEEWVLDQCLKSKINPEKFFLPNDAKLLKKVINLRLTHFNNLLNELKRKENDGLRYLQSEIIKANHSE